MFFFQRKAKKNMFVKIFRGSGKKKNVFVGLICSFVFCKVVSPRSLPKSPAPVSCMCSSTFNTPDPQSHRRRWTRVEFITRICHWKSPSHPFAPPQSHRRRWVGNLGNHLSSPSMHVSPSQIPSHRHRWVEYARHIRMSNLQKQLKLHLLMHTFRNLPTS